MKKKNNMEELNLDTEELEMREVPINRPESVVKETPKKKEEPTGRQLVNCLRNERIIVRHIPKQTGLVTNPKHVLYGGMAENSVRIFVVPKLSSGIYKNVLTDEEKEFLEDIMGLEYNALSIYKKGKDNFWDDSNSNGINKVRLTKQDTYLDLRSPEDYIRYKILLANNNTIAPSLQVYQDRPKTTYQFVLIGENSETQTAQDNVSTLMKCYKEFGKVEDNFDVLRLIVETMDGRPTSQNVKLAFLKAKVNDLIQENSRTFYRVITDPLLHTKVLIKKAIEAGVIAKRGDYLYYRDGNFPLCENNEEPTLSIAAKYLNAPKHQDLKFAIEAKLDK